MQILDNLIAKEFKHYDLYNLDFKRDVIIDRLSKIPQFKSLGEDQKEALIEAELNKHAIIFGEFASAILGDIYEMKVSGLLADLLTMRRSHIIKFFKEQAMNVKTMDAPPLEDPDANNSKITSSTLQSLFANDLIEGNLSNPVEDGLSTLLSKVAKDPVEASKVFIVELIYIRIIYPHLTKTMPISTHPVENRVMMQVTRVLQNLVGGGRFGEGQGAYQNLNFLLDAFAESHENFLEKYTMGKEQRSK